MHTRATRSQQARNPRRERERTRAQVVPDAAEQQMAQAGTPRYLEDQAEQTTEQLGGQQETPLGEPANAPLDAALDQGTDALDALPSPEQEQDEDSEGSEAQEVEQPPTHRNADAEADAPEELFSIEQGEAETADGSEDGGDGADDGGGGGEDEEAGADDAEAAEAEGGQAEDATGDDEASGDGEGEEGGAAGGGQGSGGGGGIGGGSADTAVPSQDALDALSTGDIALIDEELAEHQRWGAASERVGAAGSEDRARFITDQAGAGALGGFAHGGLMGAGIGFVSQGLEIGAARLVARLAGPALARSFPLPAIGAVIGGVFSAYDLATRDWGQTGETIGRFGEGGSIYEQLANSIAAVSEIIGIATAVLNVIAGVIGAISIAMWVITVLTVGVASPLAATLSTISMAIGIGTMILDGINALVLQRLVTLFRALHTFTSQADPTDVEQQGARINQAAAASAGFVGGLVGGVGGGAATSRGAARLGIGHPPPRVPDVDPPRAASGDGPTITADPPPAAAADAPGGMVTPDAPAPVAEAPAVPRETAGPVADAPAPVAEAPAAPRDVAQATAMDAPQQRRVSDDQTAPPSDSNATPSTEPQQLSLPGIDDAPAAPTASVADAPAAPAADSGGGATRGRMEALTDPLQLEAFTGAEPVPQGLEPGSLGSYGRAVDSPHPLMLESNPPGAPGATQRGGRMPQSGRQDAGVFYEHQAPARTMNEVLPGHEYDSPTGRRRGGRDVQEAPVISLPESVKSAKDALDAALLAEVRARQAAGEQVPPVEVTVRGAEHVQQVTAPPDVDVPGYQVSKNFLVEQDFFHDPRFGYQEGRSVPPGPDGQPLRDVSEAELGRFLDEAIDPLAAPPGTQLNLPGMEHPAPRPSVPPPEQLALPFPEMPDARQLELPFDAPRQVTDSGPTAPRQVAGGSTRNIMPLSPEVRARARQRAEQMGMPPENIHDYSGNTSYWPGMDQLLIGPDLLPKPPGERPPNLVNPANAALGPDAVIGHEVIGHREAAQAGQTRHADWHEEFQASTRAALHTPDLPRDQMWLLTQDAAARRRFQEEPGTIFVYTDRDGVPIRDSAGGGERPASHFRPEDQLPSVIIDYDRLGVPRPGARGAPQAEAPARSAAPQASAAELASMAATGATGAMATMPGGGSGGQGGGQGAGQRPGGTGGSTGPGQRTISATTAAEPRTAPRATETQRSAALASGARAGANAAIDTAAPGVRSAWNAYFGSGSREQREQRGGTVGAVIGGVAGGPLGAYVGQQVGSGVARRAEDFNAGLERGAQPVVEPVNPAYPPPPGNGTRQEIADMQNRLLAILQARAQAQTLEEMMSDDAQHHEANSAPLADYNQRTGQTISANQAHEQAVARRTAANQQQQAQEGNVTGTLQDYGNRAAGLATLTGPLRAFTRFTYLAHALPDSPNVLRGAKRGILKMNSDGQNFLNALDGIDGAVAEQQTAQPGRSAEVAANAGRLDAAAQGAAADQAQLATVQAEGQVVAQQNDARAADSRQREARAAQTGADLDGQAEQTRAEIASLTEQWQSWAQAHRQARADAMAQTRAAMIERGWQPREESEGGGS